MANARTKKQAKSGSKKVKSKKPVAARKKAPVKAKKVAKKAAAPKKKMAPKKVKKPAPAAKKKVAAVKKKALHPTVKSALEKADIEGLISRLPPPVQPIVKSLRALVLDAAPEASELLEDGAPAYFANGIFARIVPSERAVLVRFLKGAQLPSSSELKNDTLSLTDVAQLKENVLRKLVREAVMLNLTTPTASA